MEEGGAAYFSTVPDHIYTAEANISSVAILAIPRPRYTYSKHGR